MILFVYLHDRMMLSVVANCFRLKSAHFEVFFKKRLVFCVLFFTLAKQILRTTCLSKSHQCALKRTRLTTLNSEYYVEKLNAMLYLCKIVFKVPILNAILLCFA